MLPISSTRVKSIRVSRRFMPPALRDSEIVPIVVTQGSAAGQTPRATLDSAHGVPQTGTQQSVLPATQKTQPVF